MTFDPIEYKKAWYQQNKTRLRIKALKIYRINHPDAISRTKRLHLRYLLKTNRTAYNHEIYMERRKIVLGNAMKRYYKKHPNAIPRPVMKIVKALPKAKFSEYEVEI